MAFDYTLDFAKIDFRRHPEHYRITSRETIAACRFYNVIEDVPIIYPAPVQGIASVHQPFDLSDVLQFTPSLCRTDIEISIELKIGGAGFAFIRPRYEEGESLSQTY